MADVVHIDTSFLIRALVAGSPESRALQRWVSAGAVLAVSTLVWCEFLCGPVDAEAEALALRVVRVQVPLGVGEATAAAGLFNETGRRRGSLSDCIVAATAMRSGARLATTDREDFRRFEAHGLELVT